MRTTVCSAIGTILIFFAVCGPASAMMCSDNDELKTLYEYSQIAEAAKNNKLDDMEECVDNDGTKITKRLSGFDEVFVPKAFTNLVKRRTEEEFARLQPSQEDSLQFTVGCHSRNKLLDILIDFSFKLLVRTRSVSEYS